MTGQRGITLECRLGKRRAKQLYVNLFYRLVVPAGEFFRWRIRLVVRGGTVLRGGLRYRVACRAIVAIACGLTIRRIVLLVPVCSLSGAAANVGPVDDDRIFGRSGAEVLGRGPNTDPAQVEAIGVPASLHSNVAFRQSVGVVSACVNQEVEVFNWQVNDCSVELLGKVGGAVAVLGIVTIIQTTGIVQVGEKLDDVQLCPGLFGYSAAVHFNAAPVMDAMYAVPVKGELILNYVK